MHEYVENRYLGWHVQDSVLFNVRDGEVGLRAQPGTCYLKIHNIWIEMAKKRIKTETEDFIKQKLLNVPFFANLTFPEFEKVSKAATLVKLGPGDTLLRTGQVPYNMYIIVEG